MRGLVTAPDGYLSTLFWRSSRRAVGMRGARVPAELLLRGYNAAHYVVCLTLTRSSPSGEAIIGIELATAYWRRQAGTEIVSGLIPWAFERLQLDALLADTAPGNRAAARLAETMGFVRTQRAGGQWWRLARPTAIDKNQIDEPAFQRSDRLDR
ncbi:MAG: GNAT family N-acetyltransferase [Rhizobiales bacterium]|nr:GNAT family N-acetyltransferase [Hyphomicrobiales bacterium]